MHRIAKLGVVSFAKIMALVQMAVATVIFVPMFLIMGAVGTVAGEAAGVGAGPGLGVLFGSLIGFPIMIVLQGAVGFLMGALAAWIYNVVAKRFGGIEMQLEAVPVPAPPSTPVPAQQ